MTSAAKYTNAESAAIILLTLVTQPEEVAMLREGGQIRSGELREQVVRFRRRKVPEEEAERRLRRRRRRSDGGHSWRR